jgi:hypothetical protein
MSDEIVVSYERHGTAYEGTIEGQAFSGKTFAQMMTLVHMRLVKLPKARLIMQRTERPGLMPVEVAPEDVELLRVDPVTYIRKHTVEPITVDMRGSRKGQHALARGERVEIPKSSGIRAGHDTIAEAFGEVVYARMRNNNVESPNDGRWVTLQTLESWLKAAPTEVVTPELGWVGIRVADLLRTQNSRFYLPREWNPHRSWITKEQLIELLEQFEEEKVALCQSAEVVQTS